MWSFFSRDPSKDFNYEIGNIVTGAYEDYSLWKLHEGKRKGTGELVSIFAFDVKKGSETQLEIAKLSVKRLKTLRHPNVTVYIDSLETDKVLYLVTEYVEPLANHLHNKERNEKQQELEISWGLHQITKGISFLTNDCSLVHNNVCIWSILKNQAGEWKLSGFDYTCSFSDLPPLKILTQLEKYDPPEKSDTNRKKLSNKWSADMWGLGCLIWEVFNGPLTKTAQLKNPGKIPKALVSFYCELVSANPASRPNPAEFINRCRNTGGFFNNNFINSLLFLDEIQIKDANDKTRFFNNLTSLLDSFPPETCKYKILPQLINAYEFGNAGSAVLSPMFKLGKLLDTEEYQKKIVPCVVKLFTSTDRATRARLLQQMENFVDYLQPAIINDQIFPKVLQGFMDTNPTIRESTVKAMLHLAPKLNYNNINVELMKHFARMQAKDEQGGIRTNTTICLGKIAHYLHPQLRQKLLISAFARAMRDPFPPAKTAGILALAATQAYYPLNDIACKVVPALCCCCVDSDKSVRDQAFKTIKGFLGKLEKVSEDPTLAATMEAEVNAIASPTMADTAASWAGWAVSSLTSKFYKANKDNPQTAESAHANTGETTVKSTSTSVPEKKSHVTRAELMAGKQESTSDSEDDWNDDWGQLDSREEGKASNLASPTDSHKDGWSEDDWGALEDESPVKEMSTTKEIGRWNDWTEPEFVPDDPSLLPASSINWGQSGNKQSFFDDLQEKSNVSKEKATQEVASGWDLEEDWDSVKPSKSQREERRLQRQKELQEKRNSKKTSGAMKLGEKKKIPQF